MEKRFPRFQEARKSQCWTVASVPQNRRAEAFATALTSETDMIARKLRSHPLKLPVDVHPVRSVIKAVRRQESWNGADTGGMQDLTEEELAVSDPLHIPSSREKM